MFLIAMACLYHVPVMAEGKDGGAGTGTALLTDYWTEDSGTAGSINDYLLAVTDETSPDYIPKENRIAVFDLAGESLLVKK